MKLNIPNMLTIIRILLCPVFILFIVYPFFGETVWGIFTAAAVFGIAALTDFFDGKIARARKLVTNFGTFLDPLADKFMIFSAVVSICFSKHVIPDDTAFSQIFFWCGTVIIFRELAVTSMRLVVSGEKGIVVPANYLGKIKTVTQIICVLVTLLECAFLPDLFGGVRIFGIVTTLIATLFTVISGANYFKAYWKYIKPSK